MARERGINCRLYVGDGESSEVFTAVGGEKTMTLTLNQSVTSANDKDEPDWEVSLDGRRGGQIQGSGNVNWPDTAGVARLRTVWLAGSVFNARAIVNAAGDRFAAAWRVTQLTFEGPEENPTGYSVTLTSTGAVTYAAGGA